MSHRKGLNASGRFSPDGNMIALSLSVKSIPKIFIITTEGNIIKQLTNGLGNDISPSWSPDGAYIAYVSDQAGSPQIYVVPVNSDYFLQYGPGLVSQRRHASVYSEDRWSVSGLCDQAGRQRL